MDFRLNPIIDGDEAGETLVFVQGWPDDASLWESQVEALADRYRCVRITLPNFDGARDARWGHSTEEILDALADCVREVSPNDSVTLIVHDWGSLWGHVMHNRHPELAHRVVTLDVAPHLQPKLWAVPAIVVYQGWLAGAFLIGGRVGDWMTRRMAGAMGAPAPSGRLTAWMNYPYRNMFADIVKGRARTFGNDYWPEIPLLLVYGERKPFPFHSAAWVEHVERTGGRVVGLDCGHWVMLDPTFNEVLSAWLEATDR
jgi:pimeloyl-ACP methyl ester carboxylesterase